MIVDAIEILLNFLFPFVVNFKVTFVLGVPVGFVRRRLFKGTLGRRGGAMRGLTEPIDLILSVYFIVYVVIVIVLMMMPRLKTAFMGVTGGVRRGVPIFRG